MDYERNTETEQIVWQIVGEIEDFDDIRIAQPKICVLDCSKPKKSEGRLVFADIKPVPEQYKALCEFDYIITIYTHNTALLNDMQFRILLEHELRHVNIINGSKGIVYGTVGHDFEDFYAIIDKYGIEWSTVDA
jgi:hypothetical protein